MAEAGNQKLIKDGEMTPKPDKEGVKVSICDPGWFDVKNLFKIAKAPDRTAQLEFSGSDLNFVARVLYAESAGSAQIKDKTTRLKEKEAILNVKHFRLNRAGYPNRKKAQSFTEVCKAPNQFESVYESSIKFAGSDTDTHVLLKRAECSDLAEAIEAISKFMSEGPNAEYLFDNFRGGKGKRGITIGLSRFWLSTAGAKFHGSEK